MLGDEDLRKHMGMKGRQRVQERYDAAAGVPRTVQMTDTVACNETPHDLKPMLGTLKDLFVALIPPPQADAAAGEHTLQLATAVMLVEVMRADSQFGAAERRAVIAALREKFALSDDELDQLVELAAQTARDATDWFAFTSHVNEHFDMPQKLRMVEHMWRVAYADGHLSAHEQHVLWRVADLLHVPHGAYIHAKMRARDAAGAA